MDFRSLQLTMFSIFGFLSIYFYYIFYNFHGESKKYMPIFLFLIFSLYAIYVAVSQSFLQKKSEFTVGKIIGFFLSTLFLVTCFYFFVVGASVSHSFLFFFKVIFILLGVSLLWYIIWSIGETLREKILGINIKNEFLKMSISLILGFGIFILSLFCLGLLDFLNVAGILAVLAVFSATSYKSFLFGIGRFLSYSLSEYNHELENHSFFSRYSVRKILDELHVVVISFLLSVNFISVYRPFPIGWDDLGVYMNYPKLLSEAGGLMELGQMYAWQLYTSIGFVFGSQTYAFFLNSFSGVLVSLAVYLLVRIFIPQKQQKFDYGLLVVLIILAMPMTIFQLAKDMKLDYGLLFVSILGIATFFGALFQENESRKKNLMLLIAGIALGLAFSVKVTSLLLIVGIFAAFYFYGAGMLGFMFFLTLFLGIFSVANLWPVMNIVIPEGTPIREFGFISLIISGISALLLGMKQRKIFQGLIQQSMVILLGICISLSPWIIKNTYYLSKAEREITPMSLLGGASMSFQADYLKIYTVSELKSIESEYSGKISEKGTTDNADFGRYFGYEEGINNYLKLPWNLTFQVNQKGEFTDITYIFFAFIAVFVLFLPFGKKEYLYPGIVCSFLMLLYFIPTIPFTSIINPVNSLLTQAFSQILLPYGYVVIFFFLFLPFFYIQYFSEKTQQSKVYLSILAFFLVYVFLWQISAFGVVWYGIVMYTLFLVLVFYAIENFSNENTSENTLSYAHYFILAIVWVYLFQSSIPHGITNLAQAKQSLSYKLGQVEEHAAIFQSHPDYAPILFHLNIQKEKQGELIQEYKKKFASIIYSSDIQNKDTLFSYIKNIDSMAELHSFVVRTLRISSTPTFSLEMKKLQKEIYTQITSPGQEYPNKDKVYRLGTFLLYYISENYQRIYSDSLVTEFDKYLYDDDYSVVTERMKKLKMTSMLIDLNAATIDKDERKGLTQRYEKVLKYLTFPNLSLVETDSICLKLALDEYSQNQDMEKYMQLAGVNYGNDRGTKKQACIIKVLELIEGKKISSESYSYLLPYQNYVLQNAKEEYKLEDYIKLLAPAIKNGYKALFEVK